jgi:hypothetical protein
MADNTPAAPAEVVTVGAPVPGEDVAKVNEPTRFAAAQQERPPVVFVRATEDLYAHGVRAAVAGDLVPASVAKNNGWDKQVEKI